MISQGVWLDRLELEDVGIFDRYACVGWFPRAVLFEWTDSWCWRIKFACNETDLVIKSGRSCEKVCAEFAR